jgi:ribosomal protein S21
MLRALQPISGLLSTALPAACSSTLQAVRHVNVTSEVTNNNVEAAYGSLNRQCKESGLYEEFRKRQHFVPYQEVKFAKGRNKYNKLMGQAIRDRLKWVVKRRRHSLCECLGCSAALPAW